MINDIFAAFKRYWPRLWESRFEGNEEFLNQTRRSWMRDLPAWITANNAVRGLSKAHAQSKYPPGLAEFIAFCALEPGDIGAPPVERAYIEACNSSKPREDYRWSHRLVYYAASRVGWFDLSTGSKKDIFPTFREAYRSVLREFDSGVEFPSPRIKKIKPHAKENILSRAENCARMSSLKSALFDE